ncbi:IS66 family transposase [Pseudomonas aeruginosa]|nr:IS66 family transposase [Pseudomonas aeruginosa]
MQRQLDWFKKQLFGPKSEKQVYDLPEQGGLFQSNDAASPEKPLDAEKRPVRAYQRGTGKKQRDDDCLNDTGLRFTADVPVEVVEHLPPELSGPDADQYDILGTKTTYRLAQRTSSYVVLQVERPVFRRKGSDKPVTTPAPSNVLDNSLADVSLLAGLMVDKFQFHLPLYRQHQRIQQAGITLSRSTLTNLIKRSIDLLRPIVDAQTDSRGRAHIEQVLNEQFSGTLISDGYAAYARYAAAQQNIIHAQCWVHSRRYFIEAQKDHPITATEALQQIAKLYTNEEEIRVQQLTGEKKRQYRLLHSKPVVSDFFQWCRDQLAQGGLLPSDLLTKALNYVLSREASLTVFLEDPDVQPDTNHLERALRPIPMGRKNWLFCWTELGAEHVGIIQSLITTCKLHDINPYTYLVDVLQRISQHPASKVADLTPRLWKTRFADNPLRSLIDPRHSDRQTAQPKGTLHAH